MAISAKKRLTNDKYNAKCTQINIKPLSQEAAAIKAAAVASGQSLQGYILQAVRARMQAEGQPLTVGDPSDQKSVNDQNCGEEGGL
jgi:hypothetical protein